MGNQCMDDATAYMNKVVHGILEEQRAFDIGGDDEILNLWKASKLDLTEEIPDPEPLLTIDDKPIFTRGNFSYVVGKPGTRKTFFCTAIAGACLNADGYMGIGNPNGIGKVLWIDTEQAKGHVSKVAKRVHRIAGIPLNKNDDRFTIVALREYERKKRAELVEYGIRYVRPDLVILDGVADLINDSNDMAESNNVIETIMRITTELNMHLLTVIHSNYGTPKARGHVGSEALRKAETAIILTVEDTQPAENYVTSVHVEKARNSLPPKDFAFTVSDNLPILADFYSTSSNSSNSSSIKDDEIHVAVANVMKHGEQVSYGELASRLMNITSKSEPTCKRYISKAEKMGYIVKHANKYSLPLIITQEEKLPF